MPDFRIDISGLDELGRKAKALHGEHKVRIDELFPPRFMTKYTDFASVDEMIKASGLSVERGDFEKIRGAEWDKFINDRTRFSNWQEMLNKAGTEWGLRKLGFSQ